MCASVVTFLQHNPNSQFWSQTVCHRARQIPESPIMSESCALLQCKPHIHTQTHSQHRTWKIHVKVINEFTLQHQHHSYTAECMRLHSKPGQFGGENGFTSRVIIRKMGVWEEGPVRKGMRVLEGFTAHRAVSIHYVERPRARLLDPGECTSRRNVCKSFVDPRRLDALTPWISFQRESEILSSLFDC